MGGVQRVWSSTKTRPPVLMGPDEHSLAMTVVEGAGEVKFLVHKDKRDDLDAIKTLTQCTTICYIYLPIAAGSF